VTSPVRPETDRKIDELLTRFPMKGSALLPALYLVQEERGHVSEESMEYVASRIGVSAAFVAGVVSFYTMFHRKPVGRHHIQVCRTLPCALRGSNGLMAHIKGRLGLRDGETRADGKVSLTSVECLGACDRAPFLQINEREFGPVDAAYLEETGILQSAVLSFTHHVLGAEADQAIPTDELARTIIGGYRDFFQHPTRVEARVFGRIAHADQMLEHRHTMLCPEMSLLEVLAAICDFRRRPPGWWLAGQARLGGQELRKTCLVARVDRIEHVISGHLAPPPTGKPPNPYNDSQRALLWPSTG